VRGIDGEGLGCGREHVGDDVSEKLPQLAFGDVRIVAVFCDVGREFLRQARAYIGADQGVFQILHSVRVEALFGEDAG
jgi:hypothetical protein